MNEADWALLCGAGTSNLTIWSNGDFGACFESLMFGCVPNILWMIVSAYHSARHQHMRVRGRLPLSTTLLSRLFTALLFVLAPLIVVALLYLYEQLQPGLISLVTFVLTSVSWTIHCVFVWRLHRLRHIHLRGTPTTVLTFILSVICTGVSLRSAIIHQAYGIGHAMTATEEYFIYCVSGLHVIYAITLLPSVRDEISSGILDIQDSISRTSIDDRDPLYSSDTDSRSPNDLQLDEERTGLRHTTAEDGCGFWSRLWFTWVGPLMTFGASGHLNNAQQLFQLPKSLRTKVVEQKFRRFIARSGDLDDYDSVSNQCKALNGNNHCIVVPDFSSYSVEVAYRNTETGVNGDDRESDSYSDSPRSRIDVTEDVPTSDDVKSSSLLSALNRAFGIEYFSLGILRFLTDAMTFSGPILLNLLVSYMEAGSKDSEPTWHGYVYACALALTTFIGALFNTHYNYLVYRVGYKMRAAVITSIYRKTLSISYADLSAFSSGEVANFMSVDTDRMVNFCPSFHQFWSLPVQIAVALYLLYLQVGVAFLAGLGFAILLIPVNKWLAGKIGRLSQSLMAQKDSRVKFWLSWMVL